ncbi:hypothetical protein H2204_009344 [Knufia peltigerae]|uniref:Metallo-beta-lactamase domain-containing protein n=1 Tax=Knufia peltigerae TaxID=1002370 RepID=A0AA38XZB5_9EURO|nr:hypothetical protein H2204_009344 [Knufia peltigerae]
MSINQGLLRVFPLNFITQNRNGQNPVAKATRGNTTRTLLFDAGPEGEAFERNVGRLGLKDNAIGEVEIIVLSHWHRDHSGGLIKAIEMVNAARPKNATGSSLSGPVVDVPTDRPLYRGIATPNGPICLEADPTADELIGAGADVVDDGESHVVMDGFFAVTGPIPRSTIYETGIPGGLRFDGPKGQEGGQWIKDEEIKEERVVVCRIKGKGLVIFTGCSHAGIINITDYVLDTFSTEARKSHDFYALVGGYHLADASEDRLQNTLVDLTKLKPCLLMPGHCTGWRFRALLEQEPLASAEDTDGHRQRRTLKGRTVPVFAGNKYCISGSS